jgi:hypothetical protein
MGRLSLESERQADGKVGVDLADVMYGLRLAAQIYGDKPVPERDEERE